jgi:uncharacterized membrane protein YtjA (UPF0391 family)
MFGWALMFLLLASLAAIFGFGGAYTTVVWVAQLFFAAFLVLFVGSLIAGGVGRSSGRVP